MKKKQKNYYAELFKTCRRFWSMRDPVRKSCLKESHTKKDGLDKYTCAECKKLYSKSDVQVDHVYAIGSQPHDLLTFKESVVRLHTTTLQILCRTCHKSKTKRDIKRIKMSSTFEKINSGLHFFGYVQLTSSQFDDICKSKIKQITIFLDKMRCEDEHFCKNKQKLDKILDNI